MNRSRSISTLGLLSAGVLLPRMVGATEAPLRIGSVAIDVTAECYYSDAMGFFDKAGLLVDHQTMANGPAITAAVVSGALDIGVSNIFSLAQAHQRGIPITLVAPGGLYSANAPASALVVSLTSSIKRPADFVGKTIACVALRGIAQFGPLAWLDQQSVDWRSVRFIEMPFHAMIPALVQGQIDGAMIEEPVLSQSRADVRVLAHPYNAIASSFLVSAYFSTMLFADTHRDVIGTFSSVIAKTAAWANQNHEKSAVILAKATEQKLDVVKTMTRSAYAEKLTTALLQPSIDAAAKYGGLTAPFAASNLIYKA